MRKGTAERGREGGRPGTTPQNEGCGVTAVRKATSKREALKGENAYPETTEPISAIKYVNSYHHDDKPL